MNLLQVYLIRQTSLMALTLASFTSSTPSLVKTAGAGSEIAWSKYGKHRSWIFQRSANSCMDNAFNRGVDPNVCMVLRTGGIQNCSKKAWLYMNSIRPGSTVKEFDTISKLPVTYHTQQDLRIKCYTIKNTKYQVKFGLILRHALSNIQNTVVSIISLMICYST